MRGGRAGRAAGAGRAEERPEPPGPVRAGCPAGGSATPDSRAGSLGGQGLGPVGSRGLCSTLQTINNHSLPIACLTGCEVPFSEFSMNSWCVE